MRKLGREIHKFGFIVFRVYVGVSLVTSTTQYLIVLWYTLTEPASRYLYLGKLPQTTLFWWVGLIVGIGLLRRRRWAWFASLVMIPSAIVIIVVQSVLKDQPLPTGSMVMGILSLAFLLANRGFY